MLTTKQLLASGLATFTLSGKLNSGLAKRYTFRIQKVEDKGRPPVYFVKLLRGPDNNQDYVYLGVYDADGVGVRLTVKSRFKPDSYPVLILTRYLAAVRNGHEQRVTDAGWTMHWSCNCQWCGRTLTVPSSVDNRLGPDCAAQLGYKPAKAKKAPAKVDPPAPTPVVIELSEAPDTDLTGLTPHVVEGEVTHWSGRGLIVVND